MKKTTFALIACLISFLPSFGQTTAKITIPEITVSGTISDLGIFQDLRGGSYVLYVAGGRLSVSHLDAEQQGAAYDPFKGVSIPTNIRSLTIQQSGFGQFGSFIGTVAGKERLFMISVGFDAALSVHSELIDSDNGRGPIQKLQLGELSDGFSHVYYLRDNVLYFVSYPVESAALAVRSTVSAPGDKVTDFSITNAGNTALRGDYGWIKSVLSVDTLAVTLFYYESGSIVFSKKVMPVSVNASLNGFSDNQGQASFMLRQGDLVRLFTSNQASVFTESSITLPAGTIFWGSLEFLSEGLALAIVPASGGFSILLCEDISRPEPVFEQLQTLEGQFISLEYSEGQALIVNKTTAVSAVRLEQSAHPLLSLIAIPATMQYQGFIPIDTDDESAALLLLANKNAVVSAVEVFKNGTSYSVRDFIINSIKPVTDRILDSEKFAAQYLAGQFFLVDLSGRKAYGFPSTLASHSKVFNNLQSMVVSDSNSLVQITLEGTK